MIEVELPDGSIAEFPDGTPDDVMTRALSSFSQKAEPKPSFAENLGAFGNSIANGATFGFADNIAAGLATATGIDGNFGDYEGNLKIQRDRQDRNRERSPRSSLAGEVTGALGTGAGLINAGATALRGANTLGRVAAGGAIDGTILGALSGAGNADGENVLQGAATGGLLGGVVGGLAPVAIAPLSALGRSLTGKIAQNFGSRESQASARVLSAARQAGLNPQSAAQQIDDLGSEGIVLDVLGRPGGRLAKSAVNTSPEAEQVLRSTTADRLARQPDRVTESLLRASGLDQPRTLDEITRGIADETRPAIDQAYNAARAAGYDLPREPFRAVLSAPLARKAYDDAAGSLLNRVPVDGVDAASEFARLDQTKRILDGQAGRAFRAGDNSAGSEASGLARVLREAIDNNLPEAGGARALARSSFLRQNAAELGAEGARPTIPADFARRAAALPESARPDLARGFAAGKIDQINNRRTTPGAVDAIFSSPRQREALNAALGSNAPDVARQLNAESIFGRTERAFSGSDTARNLLDLGAVTAGGAATGFAFGGDTTSGSVGAIAALLARRGGGALLGRIAAKNEEAVAPVLAQMLIQRQLPQEVAEKLVQSNPALGQSLARALSIQSGANAQGFFNPAQ